MCGIAGFYSRSGLDVDRARILARAMLYYAGERGKQSAGAFVDGKIHKAAAEPLTVADSPEMAELFAADKAHVAIFHTRQPTSGGLESEHAQPFRSGDVVTAHNGVITNEDAIRSKFGIDNPSGVDSELFASYVAKHGVAKLPDMLEEMSGCAALAIAVGERLYLGRKGNPLETLRLNLGGSSALLFASTEGILLDAARHAFLIPRHTRTDTLPECQMVRVKASSLKDVGRKAAKFKVTHYSRAGASWPHEWDDDLPRVKTYTKPAPEELAVLLPLAEADYAARGRLVRVAEYGYGFWHRPAGSDSGKDERYEPWSDFKAYLSEPKHGSIGRSKKRVGNTNYGRWESLGNGAKIWRWNDAK